MVPIAFQSINYSSLWRLSQKLCFDVFEAKLMLNNTFLVSSKTQCDSSNWPTRCGRKRYKLKRYLMGFNLQILSLFQNIFFCQNCRSTNICSLHTYWVGSCVLFVSQCTFNSPNILFVNWPHAKLVSQSAWLEKCPWKAANFNFLWVIKAKKRQWTVS